MPPPHSCLPPGLPHCGPLPGPYSVGPGPVLAPGVVRGPQPLGGGPQGRVVLAGVLHTTTVFCIHGEVDTHWQAARLGSLCAPITGLELVHDLTLQGSKYRMVFRIFIASNNVLNYFAIFCNYPLLSWAR